MVFKKIEPGIWKPEKSGDEIVGILMKVDDSSKFDNKVYRLEVEESGKREFKIVFGSAILDDRMSYVKQGDKVMIVYMGTEKSKKGKDTKMFDVFVDENPRTE